MQRFRERSTRNEQASAKGHVGKSLRVICDLYYVLKDQIVSYRIESNRRLFSNVRPCRTIPPLDMPKLRHPKKP